MTAYRFRPLAALIAVFAIPSAEAAICRVAVDGNGDGTSWSAPLPLQDALNSENCNEIWVRKGLYKPVVPANPSSPTTDERKISFVVQPGVRVYGGFAGTESMRDQRDPQANRSVLSGDIDDNDTTDADGVVGDPDGARHSNSYHVLMLDGGTPAGPVLRSTVLDGLVITAGRGNGPSSDRFDSGGGLFCRAVNTGQECSPTLRDLLFSGNRATNGGAIYNLGTAGGISRPWIERVRFAGNQAGYGGAMYNDGSNAGRANPEIEDAEFTGNRANSYGGAMYNNAKQGVSRVRLDRVEFSGNSASYGGAMYTDASGSGNALGTLTNVTFAGNNASNDGGALYHYASSNGDTRMVIRHATFSGNAATRGGAIYNSGSSGNAANAGPILRGVILWGDSASNAGPEIYNHVAIPKVHDSLVQGGCPDGAECTGVIDANPALGVLNYHGGFSRTLVPNTGSPAINAAASASCTLTDQRRIPRAQGIACDLGAVEVAMPACHVKHDATGAGNGTSWANAYPDLQAALADANCGEIRVAKGVYKPTAGTDQTISFVIRPGQRVYGGFAGTEVELDQRDPAVNRTVLSGDIDGNDVTDADGVVVNGADRQGSNSRRIVLMDGTTAAGSIHGNTVLDGFAITAASSALEIDGGGLYCDGAGNGNECSPTLRNLLFSANMSDSGGGLMNYADGGRANPTLENITFRNNSAANFGGGGMYNRAWTGGESSPTLTNVTFVGNRGGALVNDGSYGGNSSPALNHVTFHGNIDRWTAASIYNNGMHGGSSTPTLSNVIIWGGSFMLPGESGECGGSTHVEICNSSAQPTIIASLIAGGCPAGAVCGPDVLDLDPLLGPLADNGGTTPTMVPAMDGPAVDAGDDILCARTDQRGVSRPQGVRCDIGAVEAIDDSHDRIFANGFEAD